MYVFVYLFGFLEWRDKSPTRTWGKQ